MAIPFTPDHPECLEGEIYLGNFTPEQATAIGWRTKTAGCYAYCSDGTLVPFQDQWEIRPYFVQASELSASEKLYKEDQT